jgi:hypothetical protein
MKDCSVTDDDIVEIYKRIGQNVKKVRTSKNISQLALSLPKDKQKTTRNSIKIIYQEISISLINLK